LKSGGAGTNFYKSLVIHEPRVFGRIDSPYRKARYFSNLGPRERFAFLDEYKAVIYAIQNGGEEMRIRKVHLIRELILDGLRNSLLYC
jgi:hypothetical protein